MAPCSLTNDHPPGSCVRCWRPALASSYSATTWASLVWLPMNSPTSTQAFAGLTVTSLGTLASRVLGLVRDMATVALLGMSDGGVMDAFVIAFRIPNLFRRLFGEGALTACYLPVLAEQLEHDRAAAWKLASALLTWLAAGLAALVVVGEAVCAVGWLAG